MRFHEDFHMLDEELWTTGYLPAWSSRVEAAATLRTGREGLVLEVPPSQPLWCADLHPRPMRVSGIHSANRSGAVGSRDAPQPFLDWMTVREYQPTMLGFVPQYGKIAVTCRADLPPGSMFSAWLVGLEDHPERSGEICIVEVFADSVRDGQAAVGQGIHAFRDPRLHEEFDAPARTIDVGVPHTYAVDWGASGVEFSIDGMVTKHTTQSPRYPMMLILAVFDFPIGRPQETARLAVSSVEATDLGPYSMVRGARVGH